MVSITLRVLSRPDVDHLPKIYQSLGMDYDERVLPSIGNEVLKSIVAQFDAAELITQREVVRAQYSSCLSGAPSNTVFFIGIVKNTRGLASKSGRVQYPTRRCLHYALNVWQGSFMNAIYPYFTSLTHAQQEFTQVCA
jgi:hypothetical protein